MVGRQEDVERGDEVVVARCRRVDPLPLLLECDRVAPVAERDLLVRSRRHRLAEHDESGDRRDARVARSARGSGVSPVTVVAVISSLKTVREVTCEVAPALACVPLVAETLVVTELAVRIEPSAG